LAIWFGVVDDCGNVFFFVASGDDDIGIHG